MGQTLERVNVSFGKDDLREVKNYCKKIGLRFFKTFEEISQDKNNIEYYDIASRREIYK